MKRKRTKPKLSPKIRAAIQLMVDYMHDDELESALEFRDENGDLKGHIFEDVVRVDNWLNGTGRSATQRLDAQEDDIED